LVLEEQKAEGGGDLIGLIFSPIGRYIIAGAFAIIAITTAYVWVRADAVSDYESRTTIDALERVQDAHRAGESVDISPERLRDNDGHRRD
jgi:hypothetical protein